MFGLRLGRHVLVASLALALGSATLARAEDTAPVDASRLVTIGGAVTEIVFDLGFGDQVIARDTTSLYPPAANALPDIGYMRALSPEGVLSVNPSAILMIEGSGPPPTLEVLRKAAIPVVTIPEGYNEGAIISKIDAVGKALGVEGKAAALRDKVRADLDAAQAKTRSVAPADRKRVLFVLTLQNGKIMAAGSQTAAAGILDMAGAINATSGFSGYKQLNDEAILEARPDAILMMTAGGPSQVADADILGHPAIALTPAGENKALIRMDSLVLLGFGPRTGTAIRDLATALYGDGR